MSEIETMEWSGLEPDEFMLTLEHDINIGDAQMLVSCKCTENNGDNPSPSFYMAPGRIIRFEGASFLTTSKEKEITEYNTPVWVDIELAT